ALNSHTHDVLAMGQEAWHMIGRTPGYIVAVRPLRQGAITDFEITQRMIRLLLQRAGLSRFQRPRVLICVPSAITEVERRAENEVKAEVRGRDLMSGLPKTVILSPEEVREAIDEQVRAIVDSVVQCLGASPPELAQDLIIEGIHLVGGGGMLRGFDRRISEETQIPVHLVEAPLECV